jgi:hypothetical protein
MTLFKLSPMRGLALVGFGAAMIAIHAIWVARWLS